MPNAFYKKMPAKKGPPTGHVGDEPKMPPEKTANWPGVPGPTQKKDRSAGVYKCHANPKSEGL